jgi:glycosyltransferase involved in cell wall biosynthesis
LWQAKLLPHSRSSVGLPDLRIAVISPFVDKQHGTERALTELLERLARDYRVEIHLYAQKVSDLNLGDSVAVVASDSVKGRIVWHKVPAIPGPHIVQYLWWYFANRFIRWCDTQLRRVVPDLIYSPCINSTDARAVTVHIVFSAFYEKVRPHLRFSETSPFRWPLLIHRLLYYHLIMALERRVYTNPRVALSAISELVSNQLRQFFGRSDALVVRYGVDTRQFDSQLRLARRQVERAKLALNPGEFVFLLIGNDWKKKGLDSLLEALAICKDLSARLLVVGTDNRESYKEKCERLRVGDMVKFLPPSADVVQFFAAADAYVGPSLEDAYGLPILEAMACGLPVIASTATGASEIIFDGANGLLLRNPRDTKALSDLMRGLIVSPEFVRSLGKAAERTATQESWDAHAARIFDHFSRIISENSHESSHI